MESLNIFVTAVITCIASSATTWAIAYAKNKNNNFHLYREGIVALLRGSIVDFHQKYKPLGKMPKYIKETVNAQYDAYHALGANGFIDDIKREINELEIEIDK